MIAPSRAALLFSTFVLSSSACDPPLPEAVQPVDPDSLLSMGSALTGLTPQITSISPPIGPDVGGTDITITGRNFRPGASVTFGTSPVWGVTVVSSTQLTLTLPSNPGVLGRVPVTIMLPDGKNVTRGDLFAYYSDSLELATLRTMKLPASPGTVVTGDWNGDGLSDFAVTALQTKSVEVYLGKGNGAFLPPRSIVLASTPGSLAALDVDGDGKRDLLVTLPASNSIAVLPGNGDGTFGSAKTSAALTSAYFLTTGDLNGDGKLDVVTTSGRSENVGVLLGKGDGTFEAPVTYVGALGFDVYAAYCATGDVNADGKLDLVVLEDDGWIGVLLGKGDGTFSAVKEYRIATSLFGGVTGLAVGDWNGDGAVDVAASNSSTNSLGIVLNKGDGTFPNSGSASLGILPLTLASGDYNGDGKLDVRASGYDGISTLYGKGDGTFNTVRSYGGASGDTLALADFDGDGKLDALTTNQAQATLDIFFGDGESFQGPGGLRPFGPSSALASGDLDGDGRPDLVAAAFGVNTVSVLLRSGGGGFRAARVTAVGKAPAALAIGDWNGDGKGDLMTSNVDAASVSLLLGKGDGSFNAAKNFSTGTGPIALVAADVNGS